jgi:hypothetical protein
MSNWLFTKLRTTDHVFNLHPLIDNQTNQNKGKVFSCFVDFKKAFDSIWHEGLLYKLMESGVGGKTYNIIKSMYTNNKCAVKIGEESPKQAGHKQTPQSPRTATQLDPTKS